MHLSGGGGPGWGLRQDVDGGGAGVEADQQGGGDAPGAGLEPLVPRHAVRSQPRAAVRPHPHALLGADADALRRAAGLPRGLRGPALLVAGGRTEPGAGPGPGLPAPHRGRLPELAPDRGPAPRRGAPVRAAADAGAAARRGDQRGALARPRPGGAGPCARAPVHSEGPCRRLPQLPEQRVRQHRQVPAALRPQGAQHDAAGEAGRGLGRRHGEAEEGPGEAAARLLLRMQAPARGWTGSTGFVAEPAHRRPPRAVPCGPRLGLPWCSGSLQPGPRKVVLLAPPQSSRRPSVGEALCYRNKSLYLAHSCPGDVLGCYSGFCLQSRWVRGALWVWGAKVPGMEEGAPAPSS